MNANDGVKTSKPEESRLFSSSESKPPETASESLWLMAAPLRNDPRLMPGSSAAAWDEPNAPTTGSAFVSSVSNHSGRVAVADAMQTHQVPHENV